MNRLEFLNKRITTVFQGGLGHELRGTWEWRRASAVSRRAFGSGCGHGHFAGRLRRNYGV